jgi:hypothetical protein
MHQIENAEEYMTINSYSADVVLVRHSDVCLEQRVFEGKAKRCFVFFVWSGFELWKDTQQRANQNFVHLFIGSAVLSRTNFEFWKAQWQWLFFRNQF